MAKKTAPKKNPEQAAAAPPAGHEILKHTVTITKKTILATSAGCLDMEDAIDLVESCVGGAPLKLSTTLGLFLPSDPARLLFCSRVKKAASEAGCTRPFPCATDTTLGEIVDALSC